jgi:hypothetical protein
MWSVRDCQKNKTMMTKLLILRMIEFVERYGKNWNEHVDRTSSQRIPQKSSQNMNQNADKFRKNP